MPAKVILLALIASLCAPLTQAHAQEERPLTAQELAAWQAHLEQQQAYMEAWLAYLKKWQAALEAADRQQVYAPPATEDPNYGGTRHGEPPLRHQSRDGEVVRAVHPDPEPTAEERQAEAQEDIARELRWRRYNGR